MEDSKLNFKDFYLEKSSFKDPHGNVFYFEDRIFRTIKKNFKDEYDYIKKANIYELLIKDEKLIETWEINISSISDEIYKVVEHEKVLIDTKPFEWTFSKLKKAALFHLDLHIFLLKRGYTLKDSSAYNVKFIKDKPIFVDFLSIKKYKENDYWNGYDQFCKEFLNPLILSSKFNMEFNSLYKGFSNGIPTSFTNKLLGLKVYFNLFNFIHIFLKSYLENRNFKNNLQIKKNFKLSSYIFLLESFKKKIIKLNYNFKSSFWSKYYNNCNYSDVAGKEKIIIFKDYIQNNNITRLLDLGCNTGKYSILASDMGVNEIVAIDNDFDSLEILEKNTKKNIFAINKNLALEIQNHNEKNFTNKYNCSGVIAFALLHHLNITENLPLEKIISYIVKNSNTGLIEFVSKDDPMVMSMIKVRDKNYEEYNLEKLKKIISCYCKIEKIHELTKSKRFIIEFKKY